MQFKKSALIGTALTILSFPLITNANLITTNNTSEYSSVQIISLSPNRCSGQAHDDVGITKPHSTTDTSTTDVKALCSKTPCIAKILMETDYNSAKTCSGNVIDIGTAEIDDLNSDVVTSINVTNTHYSVTGNGSNHITIDKIQ